MEYKYKNKLFVFHHQLKGHKNAMASANTVTNLFALIIHQWCTCLCFLGLCSTNRKNPICVASPIEVPREAQARAATVNSRFAKILHIPLFPWVMQHKYKNKFFVFHHQLNDTKCHSKRKHCYQAFCKNTSPILHLALFPLVMQHKQKKILFLLHRPLKCHGKAQTLLPAFLH